MRPHKVHDLTTVGTRLYTSKMFFFSARTRSACFTNIVPWAIGAIRQTIGAIQQLTPANSFGKTAFSSINILTFIFMIITLLFSCLACFIVCLVFVSGVFHILSSSLASLNYFTLRRLSRQLKAWILKLL